MTHRIFVSVSALALCLACGASPAELHMPAPPPASVLERGEPIYVGRVYPLGEAASAPTFEYERRVAGSGDDSLSTHVTRDPSGAVVLAESARHTADYRLLDYRLYANQLGQSGSVHVDGDRLTFRRLDASGEHVAEERVAEPVAVGPTLVGYIRQHLTELRRGETVPVRLALLDRLETLGFELSAVGAEPGQTRIEMQPASALIALVVDPILFTFQAQGDKLVCLEGRVPPKRPSGGGWDDFDARVEYRYLASEYR